MSKKLKARRKQRHMGTDEKPNGAMKVSEKHDEGADTNDSKSHVQIGNGTSPQEVPGLNSSENKVGSRTCKTHPDQELMSSDEVMKSLKSSYIGDKLSVDNPTSLLCSSCSVTVACYFDYMQETMKNVMADLLGLEKSRRCLKCVKHQLQNDMLSRRANPDSCEAEESKDPVEQPREEGIAGAKSAEHREEKAPIIGDVKSDFKLQVDEAKTQEKTQEMTQDKTQEKTLEKTLESPECPFVNRSSDSKVS